MLLGKSFSNAYVYEINVYILKLQNAICQLYINKASAGGDGENKVSLTIASPHWSFIDV